MFRSRKKNRGKNKDPTRETSAGVFNYVRREKSDSPKTAAQEATN